MFVREYSVFYRVGGELQVDIRAGKSSVMLSARFTANSGHIYEVIDARSFCAFEERDVPSITIADGVCKVRWDANNTRPAHEYTLREFTGDQYAGEIRKLKLEHSEKLYLMHTRYRSA